MSVQNEEACKEAMRAEWNEWYAVFDEHEIPAVNMSFERAWNACWKIVEEKEAMIELLENGDDDYRGG